MTQELTTRAAVIWAAEYEGCAKSREWQAGALRGLQLALNDLPPGVGGAPYAAGTARYDAWVAGLQDGMDEGKRRLDEWAAQGEALA